MSLVVALLSPIAVNSLPVAVNFTTAAPASPSSGWVPPTPSLLPAFKYPIHYGMSYGVVKHVIPLERVRVRLFAEIDGVISAGGTGRIGLGTTDFLNPPERIRSALSRVNRQKKTRLTFATAILYFLLPSQVQRTVNFSQRTWLAGTPSFLKPLARTSVIA